MEIIGTGLSGLVGTRIVELNPGLNFTDLSLDTGFDILKPETIEETFKNNPAQTILHLAAFTDTNAAWNQKDDKNGLCYRLNVVGTQNIVNLSQKYHKHLIYISTDYVFDGSQPTPYTETDTPHPLDWYAETKFQAEKIIPSEFTIVRIASPYRAQFVPKIDLVRKIISKLSQNQICNLFTDQITTPTFIDDIALGLRKIIDNPRSGTYHLVGSSSQPIFDMGLTIARTFGYSSDLIQPSSLAEYLKTPNARPYASNLALSNRKIIADYGFVPRTLTEGLLELKRQLSLPLSPRN